MDKHKATDDRTLQDDRAELEADPHEGSPLAEGEGAPLAEDTVPGPDNRATTTPLMIGGAPVPVATENLGLAPSTGGLTAADDRPIDD